MQLPGFAIHAVASPVKTITMQPQPTVEWKYRYDRYFKSLPIEIIGFNMAPRRKDTYTLTSLCGGILFDNGVSSVADNVTFEMDFLTRDINVVYSLVITMSAHLFTSSISSSCFKLALASDNTKVLTRRPMVSLTVEMPPPILGVNVMSSAPVAMAELPGDSTFTVSYEIMLFSPVVLDSSVSVVFKTTGSCFCPNLATATAMKSGFSIVNSTVLTPDVPASCSVTSFKATNFTLVCSSTRPANTFTVFGISCPTAFKASALLPCLTGGLATSLNASIPTAPIVTGIDPVFNGGTHVYHYVRYTGRSNPFGVSLALGLASKIMQTVEFVLIFFSLPKDSCNIKYVSTSEVTVDAVANSLLPSSTALIAGCSMINTTTLACSPTAQEVFSTLLLTGVVSQISDASILYAAAYLSLQFDSVIATHVPTDHFLPLASFSGPPFAYFISGADPVGYYTSIRFTPQFMIVPLHPTMANGTTLITITFSCSSTFTITTSIPLTLQNAGSGTAISATLTATGASLSIKAVLGRYMWFAAPTAMQITRAMWESNYPAGMGPTCMQASTSSATAGTAVGSLIGPFPSAIVPPPLYYVTAAGTPVTTNLATGASYTLRFSFSPRIEMPTKSVIKIALDATLPGCDMDVSGFTLSTASVSVVTTVRSGVLVCSKTLAAKSSYTTTCVGSYNFATDGEILLSLGPVEITRVANTYASVLHGACILTSIDYQNTGFTDTYSITLSGAFKLPNIVSVIPQHTIAEPNLPVLMLLGKAALPSGVVKEFRIDMPNHVAALNSSTFTFIRPTTSTVFSGFTPTLDMMHNQLSFSGKSSSLQQCNSVAGLSSSCAALMSFTDIAADYTTLLPLFEYAPVWDILSTRTGIVSYAPLTRTPLVAQGNSGRFTSASLSYESKETGNKLMKLVLRYTLSFNSSTLTHMITFPFSASYAGVLVAYTGFDTLVCEANACIGTANAAYSGYSATFDDIQGLLAPFQLITATIAVYDSVKNADLVLGLSAALSREARALEAYERSQRPVASQYVSSQLTFFGGLPVPSTYGHTISGDDATIISTFSVALLNAHIYIVPDRPDIDLVTQVVPTSPHLVSGGTATIVAIFVYDSTNVTCNGTAKSAGVISLRACVTTQFPLLRLQVTMSYLKYIPIRGVWLDVLFGSDKFSRFSIEPPPTPQLMTIAMPPVLARTSPYDTVTLSVTSAKGLVMSKVYADALLLIFTLSNTDATLAQCGTAASQVTWQTTGITACALARCTFDAATTASPIETLTCTLPTTKSSCYGNAVATVTDPIKIALKQCVRHDSDLGRTPALTVAIGESASKPYWQGSTYLTNVGGIITPVTMPAMTNVAIAGGRRYTGSIPAAQCARGYSMYADDILRVYQTMHSNFVLYGLNASLLIKDNTDGDKTLVPVAMTYTSIDFVLPSSVQSAFICSSTVTGTFVLSTQNSLPIGKLYFRLMTRSGVKIEYNGVISGTSSMVQDMTATNTAYSGWVTRRNMSVPELSFTIDMGDRALGAPYYVQATFTSLCVYSYSMARLFPPSTDNELLRVILHDEPSVLSADSITLMFSTNMTTAFSANVKVYGLYCKSGSLAFTAYNPVDTTESLPFLSLVVPALTGDANFVGQAVVAGAYKTQVSGVPTGPATNFFSKGAATVQLLIPFTSIVPITRTTTIVITGVGISTCANAALLGSDMTRASGFTATASAGCKVTLKFASLPENVEPYTPLFLVVIDAKPLDTINSDFDSTADSFSVLISNTQHLVLAPISVRPQLSKYHELTASAITMTMSTTTRANKISFTLTGNGKRIIPIGGPPMTLRVRINLKNAGVSLMTEGATLTVTPKGTIATLVVKSTTFTGERVVPHGELATGIQSAVDLSFEYVLNTTGTQYFSSGSYGFAFTIDNVHVRGGLLATMPTYLAVWLLNDLDPVYSYVPSIAVSFPVSLKTGRFTSGLYALSNVPRTLFQRPHMMGASAENFATYQTDHLGSDGPGLMTWRARLYMTSNRAVVIVLPQEITAAATRSSYIGTFYTDVSYTEAIDIPEYEYDGKTIPAQTIYVTRTGRTSRPACVACTDAVKSLICATPSELNLRGGTASICLLSLSEGCITCSVTSNLFPSTYMTIEIANLTRTKTITNSARRFPFTTIFGANSAMTTLTSPSYFYSAGLNRNWDFGTASRFIKSANYTPTPDVLKIDTANTTSGAVCRTIDMMTNTIYAVSNTGHLSAVYMQNVASSAGLDNSPIGRWVRQEQYAFMLLQDTCSVRHCWITVAPDALHLAINLNNEIILLVERAQRSSFTVLSSLVLPYSEPPLDVLSNKPFTARLYFAGWQNTSIASLYLVTLSGSIRMIRVDANYNWLTLSATTTVFNDTRMTSIAHDPATNVMGLCGLLKTDPLVVKCNIIRFTASQLTLVKTVHMETPYYLLPTAATLCPQSNINTFSALTDECIMVSASLLEATSASPNPQLRQYLLRFSLDTDTKPLISAIINTYPVVALEFTGYQSQIIVHHVGMDQRVVMRTLTRMDGQGRFGWMTTDRIVVDIARDPSSASIMLDGSRSVMFYLSPDYQVTTLSAVPRVYSATLQSNNVILFSTDWMMTANSTVTFGPSASSQTAIAHLTSGAVTTLSNVSYASNVNYIDTVQNPLSMQYQSRNLIDFSIKVTFLSSDSGTSATTKVMRGTPPAVPGTSLSIERSTLFSPVAGTETSWALALRISLSRAANNFSVILNTPGILFTRALTGTGHCTNNGALTIICDTSKTCLFKPNSGGSFALSDTYRFIISGIALLKYSDYLPSEDVLKLTITVTNGNCPTTSTCIGKYVATMRDMMPVLPPALPVLTGLVRTPIVTSAVDHTIAWAHGYKYSCMVAKEIAHCVDLQKTSVWSGKTRLRYFEAAPRPTQPLCPTCSLGSTISAFGSSPHGTLAFFGRTMPYSITSDPGIVSGSMITPVTPFVYNSDIISQLQPASYIHMTSSRHDEYNFAFVFNLKWDLIFVRRFSPGSAEPNSTRTVTGLDSVTSSLMATFAAAAPHSGNRFVRIATDDTGLQIVRTVDITAHTYNSLFDATVQVTLMFVFKTGYVRMCHGPAPSVNVTDPAIAVDNLLRCLDPVLVSTDEFVDAVLVPGPNTLIIATATGRFKRVQPSVDDPNSFTVTDSPLTTGCATHALALHPSHTQLSFICASGALASLTINPNNAELSELRFADRGYRTWLDLRAYQPQSISYSHFGTHLMIYTLDKSNMASVIAAPVLPFAQLSAPVTLNETIAGVLTTYTFALHLPPYNFSNGTFAAVVFPASTQLMSHRVLTSGVTNCTHNALVNGSTVIFYTVPACIDSLSLISIAIPNVVSGAETMIGETTLYAEFRVPSDDSDHATLQLVDKALENWNLAMPVTYTDSIPLPRMPIGLDFVQCSNHSAVITGALKARVDHQYCLKVHTQSVQTLSLDISIGRVNRTLDVLEDIESVKTGQPPSCQFVPSRSRYLTAIKLEAGHAVTEPIVFRCTSATTSTGADMRVLRIFLPEINTEWQSAPFMIAPTIVIATRVARGADIISDPPTLPAGVKFFIQGDWDVPPAETIILKLSSIGSVCSYTTGITFLADWMAFTQYSLQKELHTVTCSTPSTSGVQFSYAALPALVFIEMKVVMRPILGSVFLQPLTNINEPMVFNHNSIYNISLVATPVPTTNFHVELTWRKFGLSLPVMPCGFYPNNPSTFATTLTTPVTLKLKCSRPIAKEELVELFINVNANGTQPYEVVNNNIVTAYVEATTSTWPDASRFPVLTVGSLTLTPARPLSHKTTVRYTVADDDARCAFSSVKQDLAPYTSSQTAFDLADSNAPNSSDTTMNDYTTSFSIGSTSIKVNVICDTGAMGLDARIRYTILHGTPLRNEMISTGFFTLHLTERMQFRSNKLPDDNKMMDDVAFADQPNRVQLEYAVFKHTNNLDVIFYYSSIQEHSEKCTFTSLGTPMTISTDSRLYNISISNLTTSGVIELLYSCTQPFANISFAVEILTGAGQKYETNPFSIFGTLKMSMFSLEAGAVPFIIAGPDALADVVVPLSIVHTLTISSTPQTGNMTLIAEIPIRSGHCSFKSNLNTCITDALGACNLFLRCNTPAQTPPFVTAHSSGFFAFNQPVSARLRMKGSLVVQYLNASVDPLAPTFLAGEYYGVRVQFDPIPDEPIAVAISQLTSLSSCVFSLNGDRTNMQRSITWTHTMLTDMLYFGVICKRPHVVGSIISVESTAYSYSIGPIPNYGRISIEYRIPTEIVGSNMDVTDLDARAQFADTPSALNATLATPYNLRAPLTNLTVFRLRLRPAVTTHTTIYLSMSDPASGCQFSLPNENGDFNLMGSTAQLVLVLGEVDRDIAVSCEMPRLEAFSIIGNVPHGNPYVPLVSLPMKPRGSIRMTTSGVSRDLAFNGDIFSFRRWVLRFVLSPPPADTVLLIFAVVAGVNRSVVSHCTFEGESDIDVMPTNSTNTFFFTPNTALVGVALFCRDSIREDAFITAQNHAGLYEDFSSAPFRMRGAAWIEDAALPLYSQFPGTDSVLVDVAVAVPHRFRVRVAPTFTLPTLVIVSVAAAHCSLGLLRYDAFDVPMYNPTGASIEVEIAAHSNSTDAFIICDSVAHNIVIRLAPSETTQTYVSVHETGGFSARNRFSLSELPSQLHARNPLLIKLTVLPTGAIAGAGQSTTIQVSTNSVFANCSVARYSEASTITPESGLWTRITDVLSAQFVISSGDVLPIWVRCWQYTAYGNGTVVSGATKPFFMFDYVSGVAFMPTVSDALNIIYYECGELPKLQSRNVIYEDNGFGHTAYLARMTASCDTGYDLVGNNNTILPCPTQPCSWTTTCTPSGWGAEAPRCIVRNCGAPPVSGNRTTHSADYTTVGIDGNATTFGAVVNYACLVGFEPTATGTSLKCTANGWSQTAAPQCVAVTCPSLVSGTNTIAPIYGSTPSGARRYNSVATYECLPGYIISAGNLTVTCRSDRTWSPGSPVCRTNMCLQLTPDYPAQKAIMFTREAKVAGPDPATGYYHVDTLATYQCADGYDWVSTDSSDRVRRCVYSEGWVPVSPPRCAPVPCPSLPSFFYGSLTQEPEELYNQFGVTATYRCDYGANITPAGNTLTCMANGQWSGIPRTCQPYRCSTPASIADGQVTEIQQGVLGSYYNNSVVEYRCDTGYNLLYPGVALNSPYYFQTTISAGVAIEVGRRECTPNGWVPDLTPVCRVNECSQLTASANVTSIFYTNGLGARPQYRTIATYICAPGYEARDATDNITNNTRICGSRDQGWIPQEAPRCEPIDCGPVSSSAILYGNAPESVWDELTVKSPTRLGATAMYTCQDGFVFPNGSNRFYRTCAPTANWFPSEPKCVDIDECDSTLFGGKYFVNCSVLHGIKSQCINLVGSYICVPLITTTPYAPYSKKAGNVTYLAASKELVPGNTAGGQRIHFTVRSGVGLVTPFFSAVRYSNPDKMLYQDPELLLYECTEVEAVRATSVAEAAAGFSFYDVSCALSAGQGASLYLSVQYCVAVYGQAEPDCSRWNSNWQGTQAPDDLLHRDVNEGLRVTYPMPAFVRASLSSITPSGLTQRTSDYVSLTSLGEDVIMSVDNFYLKRPKLIAVSYGEGRDDSDFTYVCEFNLGIALLYSDTVLALSCRTQDGVNRIDLRFKLCIAGRCTISTDRYSYPQIPEVTSVTGCAVDDIVNGRTSECPTDSAGVRLTVTGSGFLEPLSVIISGRQCSAIDRHNNTYLTCLLPSSAGVGLPITIKAGSQRAESRNRITYTGPTITSIEGCDYVSNAEIRECHRLGGNTIALNGRNFGVTASTVMVGGQNCLNVTHDKFRPHERITCTTPPGSATERSVTLLQRSGLMSIDNILLSYVQCTPGMYGLDVSCLPCKVGYFNDMWSQNSCRQCEPGLYANKTGSTSCSICPAGYSSGLGAHTCQPCARGTFSGERSGSCLQCPPGTFAQHEGSSACEACALNAESNDDYTFCRCSVGSYLETNGECVACMLGGDCRVPGTTVFNVKSLPGYAPAVIRYARDSVIRMSLYYPASTATEEARKYARAAVSKLLYDNSELPMERIVFVDVIFETEGTLRAAANASAAASYNVSYRDMYAERIRYKIKSSLHDPRADDELVAVVKVDIYPDLRGAYAVANSTEALYTRILDQLVFNAILFGKSSNQTASTLTSDCVTRDVSFNHFATPEFELCINNACSGSNICLRGHTGNLCAVCEPGYGKSSSYECKRCNEPALRTFLLVLAVVAAIVVCGVLVWKQIIDGKQSMNELPAPAVPMLLKITTSGLQVMSIASRYELAWPGFLAGVFNAADTAGGVGTAFLSLDCFLSDSPTIRPFWVTTICIMILPLAGVLVPMGVFVPMYFTARNRYRANLIAEAVAERALAAEALIELRSLERQDRQATMQQRQKKMIVDSGLIWEHIMESDGITPETDAPTAITSFLPSPGVTPKVPSRVQGKGHRTTRRRVAKSAITEVNSSSPLPPPVSPPVGEDSTPVPSELVDDVSDEITIVQYDVTTPLPLIVSQSTPEPSTLTSPRTPAGVALGAVPVTDSAHRSPLAVRTDHIAHRILAPASPSLLYGFKLDSDRASFSSLPSCAFNPDTLTRSYSANKVGLGQPVLETPRLPRASTLVVLGATPAAGPQLSFSGSPIVGSLNAMLSHSQLPQRHRANSQQQPRYGTQPKARGTSILIPAQGNIHSDGFDVFGANDEAKWRTERALLYAFDASNIPVLPRAGSAVSDLRDWTNITRLKDESTDLDFAQNALVEPGSDEDVQGATTDVAPAKAKDIAEGEANNARVMADFASATDVGLLRKHDQSLNTGSTGTNDTPKSNEETMSSLPQSKKSRNLTAKRNIDAMFFEDDGETTDDLRQYGLKVAFDELRGSRLICDDYTLEMEYLMDNADAVAGIYAAECEFSTRTAVQGSVTHTEWTKQFEDYRNDSGDFDDERIKADAALRIDTAASSSDLANILQSAADMHNAFSVMSEPIETVYEAEVLRERTIRYERAVERARAYKKLMWYIATYGDNEGTKLYEQSQELRAKATKPRLTHNEMRKRLYAAEYTLNNVFTEFSGYVITATTVVMFMIHPNITQQFFMVLSCKSIGGTADPGASFMLGDLSEPCYSPQHVMFILVLGVPMLILWVLGIPLFAFAILFRNRALIQAPAVGTSDITRAQKRNFESQMAFMYRGYKPTRYYWFLSEMFRKAALVAISVFFPGALHTQLMLASLLIFVCILLQIFGQPFENRIPGAVEFLSLGTSFMIFFLANFLFVDTISHSAKVAATMLICVLVFAFFVVVVIAFIVLQREELKLAPLRRRLREAYIHGHDIAQVMAKWRQEKLRERKLALEKKDRAGPERLPDPTVRDSAVEIKNSPVDVTDKKPHARALAHATPIRLQNETQNHVISSVDIGSMSKSVARGHDTLLTTTFHGPTAWSRTIDEIRAQSNNGASTTHATNAIGGGGSPATAAIDAIAGACERRRAMKRNENPELVVQLDYNEEGNGDRTP